MRWVAAAAWAATGVATFVQFLSNPFPMIPNDLGPTAICLVMAGLVAVGGRVGRIAATLSAGFVGLVTVIFLLLRLDGWGSWPVVAGAAVLAAVNYLAAKETNRG
jgi:hypothetical protein